MLIQIGYEIIFNVPAPAAMNLMLDLHPSRDATVRRAGVLRIEPDVPVQSFIDSFGNRVRRIVAPAGKLRLTCDAVVEDGGLPDEVNRDAVQHPVQDLPPEVLPFLLASRYCEVDLMNDIAWKLFGRTPLGWNRVQAICDWCHANVAFGYEYARPTKSARDVYQERQGVCRDFMHMAITFCRCMNVPARYATGYLGDICVPAAPFPMDFSAWFEVYLGGRWWTWDARHNEPRVGRVLMATGRDATDVALTTSFGPTRLEKFEVWTDEVFDVQKPR